MIETPPNAVHPKTRDEWRAWLEEHHAQTEGVWLVSDKKATGKPRVEYEDAVEEALCFGWIDSKANTLDDERAMIWMCPRKPRTGWARTNKARVERLIANGRMTAAGLAKIEAAQQDGSWNAPWMRRKLWRSRPIWTKRWRSTAPRGRTSRLSRRPPGKPS